MGASVFTPGKPAVRERRQFNPRMALGIVGVIAAGYLGWRQFAPHPAPSMLIASGRIEAYETNIGAKTGGRIARILVREGDRIKRGQVVAVMEDAEVNQQLQGAIAQVNAARQDEAQARWEVSVAESRIQEAESNLAQSREDSQGRVSQAESEVAASQAQVDRARAQLVQAEAEVKRARAQLKLALADRDRYVQLGLEGVVSRQQLDQVQSNADTARATLEAAKATAIAQSSAVQAAQRQLQAARGNLTRVRSTALNPAIRESQLEAYRQQKAQAQARLAAAQAQVQGAIASQQQLQERLDSFSVKSPIDGIVQARPLEPGAVVTSGKTLLTAIDPKDIYMRAYVPEGDIGKIYTGKSARVFLDSDPDRPLPARVSAIDPEASFTPENIYFQKDRVRQVFGVKLAIEQSENYAKPGMPADAEIDLN